MVTINSAYQTYNALLGGIMSYIKTHTSWNIILATNRRDDPKQFSVKGIDGAILDNDGGKIPNWKHGHDSTRPPMVILSEDNIPDFPCCRIYCDNAPVAETAAKHLLSKHCEAYAFVHSAGQSWSDKRGRIFATAIKEAGSRFLWRTSDRKNLPRLIADSPKPLGVFAATDFLARATLDACRIAEFHVPDDVLILGVDNDPMLCEMSNPNLSSIPLSSHEAGYRAAGVLDRVMRGEITVDEMTDAPYTGNHVVERLSTSRSFADDTLVRHCRETLESEFASPIRIADLATRFHVSRRTLETHFRKITGTTIAEEIIRLRVEHARHLLATTGDSQEKIADACGFYNASHLSAVFRKRLGLRPSAFRPSALERWN